MYLYYKPMLYISDSHAFRVKLLHSKGTLSHSNNYFSNSEAYSEPYQLSKMERFAKIINGFQPLTIFAKQSILDVWQDSEYA